MSYFPAFTMLMLLCISTVTPKEIVNKRVQTQLNLTEADKNRQPLDLKAIRQMSIDAYAHSNQGRSLDGSGLNAADVGYGVAFGIIVFAGIMVLASYNCQKYLMYDFYKIQQQISIAQDARGDLKQHPN